MVTSVKAVTIPANKQVTEVRVVTRYGVNGLLLHRHGGSGWHPVENIHQGDREGSHEAYKADEAVWPEDAAITAEMRKVYAAALGGEHQEPFYGLYKEERKSKSKKGKAED